MIAKKTTRKRKQTREVVNEIEDSIKKNFDCSNLKLKRQFPLTDNQTNFYYLTQNPKTNMVFVDGPAGSAKSYCAVYTALELLKDRHADQIIYIRSVVESSSRSMGFLKGDENEKFAPYIMPLLDKMHEILDVPTAKALVEQEYVKAIPVNFCRGLTFNNAVVIIDEAQNMDRGELTTILTRFGRNTKYIICGDAKQCDINHSGFSKVFELFDTEFSRKNNIDCVKFDQSDIVRSQILKHITQVLGV